ncbi:glycerol kinase GlpK [Pacificoceanicola onchidii]|uniref:glycerol kinase GlpK n=1 Tax=Pacificoceanicola onchidii TaxID=2562685 RepID=UPI0010A65C16|nr:glycerol kinase GlpK [Pacificoceanicola onchidii]
MSDTYVLALDEGTSSARAIVFDTRGQDVAIGQQEFAQIYPKPGLVEHDAEEIWDTQLKVAREAIAKAGIEASQIAAIGITNQRETAVIWDRATGKPIHNALVWQDRRTTGACDDLRARGLEPYVSENTGLVIDAYFSGTKIAWMLDNVPGARARAEKGELAFGTIDSWLIWNLTGGEVHVTDVTNASRTLLFNIRKVDWDDKLLEEIGVPRAILPEVRNSSEVYGTSDPALFGAEIPVAAAVGDQHGALFGQACFEKGQAKCTYGTGGALMVNTGKEFVSPGQGLISTIAIGIDGKVQYATEGTLFNCGTVIQWLRDELQIIQKSSDAQCTTEDTNGVYLVPAFTGMSAPLWNQHARGTIVGLTRGANREHLIRAALESMAYQVNDIIVAIKELSGLDLSGLKVDGGACLNGFVMQFQADISDLPLMRPTVIESSARGAAFLAGLATGVWENREALANSFELETEFKPQMDRARADKLYAGWTKAVTRALDWAEEED